MVYVYFVPRVGAAQINAMWSTAPDAAGAGGPVALDPAVWWPTRPIAPLPVIIQFSGSVPEGNAPEVTIIETPPSWRSPFRNPYRARQVWTVPPQDDSAPVQPEYSQGRTPSSPFRNPYKALQPLRWLLGTPAYDESDTVAAAEDNPAQIVRNVHRKPYEGWFYFGYPAQDTDLDLDHFTRPVGRSAFRNPYKPGGALRFLQNTPVFDDTESVATQPDTAFTVLRRVFRQPYRPAAALAFALNHPAYDDSLAVVAQEETHGTVVRTIFRSPYNAKGALVFAMNAESHDDSTVIPDLTGGIYIPVLRRRRR